MAGVRLEPPVRLHPINGIEGIEHAQEPGYIWLISRGNDFQSERTHRSAIQNSRQPPHNGKLHAPFYKHCGYYHSVSINLHISSPESPKSPSKSQGGAGAPACQYPSVARTPGATPSPQSTSPQIGFVPATPTAAPPQPAPALTTNPPGGLTDRGISSVDGVLQPVPAGGRSFESFPVKR